jgi:hypothetical protein
MRCTEETTTSAKPENTWPAGYTYSEQTTAAASSVFGPTAACGRQTAAAAAMAQPRADPPRSLLRVMRVTAAAPAAMRFAVEAATEVAWRQVVATHALADD